MGLYDNHSTGYSMIGYMCAYLRYYYPVDFITAYLNNANNDSDITNGTALAKQLGIKILPPKFKYSKDKYFPDHHNNAIYKGIASIKFLNSDVAGQLYDMKDMEFKDFIDFLKINPCDTRQTEILIKLSFFSEFGKSKKLLDIYKNYQLLGNKKQISKDKINVPEDIMLKYSTATPKLYKIFDSDGMVRELCKIIPDEDISLSEMIRSELEYLGYIQTVLSVGSSYYAVADINSKYANRIVKLYQLNSGDVTTVKIKAKTFEDSPLEVGDVIKTIDISEEKKWGRTPDGEWYRKDETEFILKKWAIVR